MKALTTRINPPHPDGRCQVMWLMKGPGLRLRWVHKGWLMPQIGGRT